MIRSIHSTTDFWGKWWEVDEGTSSDTSTQMKCSERVRRVDNREEEPTSGS